MNNSYFSLQKDNSICNTDKPEKRNFYGNSCRNKHNYRANNNIGKSKEY